MPLGPAAEAGPAIGTLKSVFGSQNLAEEAARSLAKEAAPPDLARTVVGDAPDGPTQIKALADPASKTASADSWLIQATGAIVY